MSGSRKLKTSATPERLFDMSSGIIDLGGGHTLEPTTIVLPDGTRHLYGYIETHPRPDTGEPCEGAVNVKYPGRVGPAHPLWTIVQADPLTLTPSILCQTCHAHGWVRNGLWVDA